MPVDPQSLPVQPAGHGATGLGSRLASPDAAPALRNAVEVEIVDIPRLTAGQTSLLNMHSLLNVLNVLHGELTLLGYSLADDPELLRAALDLSEGIKADLVDPSAGLRHAAALPETRRAVERVIAVELERRPERVRNPEVGESLANIRSVFNVLEVRAREILARAEAPEQWVAVPLDELRADFQEVFAALVKNSRGRYRIIYNLAMQERSDYYVDFVIDGEDGRTIALPPVFKDVMRDLLANARKYTPPGGIINAGLRETADTLKFTVQDTGKGIPADELQTVIHFGRRGSNVGDVRTMGGGFGLTKAFLVTRQFGGRFWIRSGLGAGTRIRIEIPRPQRGDVG